MLYRLLYPLARYLPAFNVFRYITFRTAMAAVTALLLALLLGPPMIRLLVRRQIGQSIREEGPKSHHAKAGTPTMGGLLILLAVVVATILWMEPSNRFVWIALGTLVALGFVGFADDFVKFARRRNLGLTGRGKLIPQFLVAFAAAFAILHWAGHGSISTIVTVPFFKRLLLDLGVALYIPFVALVLVGSSNAVNLTGWMASRSGPSGSPRGRMRSSRMSREMRSPRATCKFRSSRRAESWRSSAERSWALRWGFSGSTAIRPRSSWETSERSPWAARSRRWR